MSKRGQEKFSVGDLTQESYADAIKGAGVTVVSVHQNWCGPCTAVVPVFQAAVLALGADKSMIKCYNACADDIAELEPYRNQCRPCFMFHAGGSLIDAVRGVNAPLIGNKIASHVKYEKRVLDDLEERIVFVDKAIGSRPVSGNNVDGEEEPEEEILWIETTAAIIKPDSVESGVVDTIIKRIKDAGFEIVAQKMTQMSDEDVRTLYSEHESKDFFADLLESMKAKDLMVLALRRHNAIGAWRDLLGHTFPDTAKKEQPESLRALYGTTNVKNTAHGSYSEDLAVKELKLLFGAEEGAELAKFEKVVHKRAVSAKPAPNAENGEGEAGSSDAVPAADEPTSSTADDTAATSDAAAAAAPKESTVAIIKPDAYEHADDIKSKIKGYGFTITATKEQSLTLEQATEFYAEHQGKPFLEKLTTFMTSGPIIALELEKENAIQAWRDVIGPTAAAENKEEAPECLRAIYGSDTTKNGLHGSDSPESAARESKFFFGETDIAIARPHSAKTLKENASDEDTSGNDEANPTDEAAPAADAPQTEESPAAATPTE